MENKEVLTQEGNVSLLEASGPQKHNIVETDQISPRSEHGEPEELDTLIPSQFLPQKESNTVSAREMIYLEEKNTIDSFAVTQCHTTKDLKDLTEDLNSVKKHMQQNH